MIPITIVKKVMMTLLKKSDLLVPYLVQWPSFKPMHQITSPAKVSKKISLIKLGRLLLVPVARKVQKEGTGHEILMTTRGRKVSVTEESPVGNPEARNPVNTVLVMLINMGVIVNPIIKRGQNGRRGHIVQLQNHTVQAKGPIVHPEQRPKNLPQRSLSWKRLGSRVTIMTAFYQSLKMPTLKGPFQILRHLTSPKHLKIIMLIRTARGGV